MDFSRASFDRQKHIFISLNDLCNKRCAYCYLHEDKLSRSRPVRIEALLDNLVRLYNEHAFRLITIAGGEPGIVPNLAEIVGQIAGIGYHIIINTNGTLSRGRIREIRNCNLKAISFSLDSHDRVVNDSLRFQGSWQLVQDGVRACKEEAIPVRITAVVSRPNRDDVLALFHWCNAAGVDVLNIHELDTSVDAPRLDALKLSPTEWRELVRDLSISLRDRQDHTALRMPVSYLTELESKRISEHQLSCPAITNDTLCVSPDLSAYRCPLLLNRNGVSYKEFGDSLRTEPLDGLQAIHDCARCPLSDQDGPDGSGLVDACKLVKLTINKGSVEANTPIWADILKEL